ncbi:hypothetical protein [Butyrivibrio sp. INlla21]|uniref:hypothetical protein n=1 Tax=Butyrivibrio sp. INlla21 TaxID=1520811 RepID=UPI0008E1A9E3|nr:hypothetical protein [Butyrivibrio sp. INlla21]SFU57006.1 hypothetical protein SAMN02910342_00921 [Butyrivibrio sp. INlla21]
MDTKIMLSFMQKLYNCAYGNGILTAHLRTTDDVLDIDTAFTVDHWELSANKESMTLYGEDDMKVVFNPQYLTKASVEGDDFVFNTGNVEMVVGFI